MNRLGQMLFEKWDYKGALDAFTDSLEFLRQVEEPPVEDTVKVLNNLGAMHIIQDEFLQAEPFLQQAAELARNDLPGNNKARLDSLLNLALAVEKLGRHSEATGVWREILEAVGPYRQDKDPLVQRAIGELARLTGRK